MLNLPVLTFVLLAADGGAVAPSPATGTDPPTTTATPTPETTATETATNTVSLLSPTTMERRRPLVTDRPDLTESPITVDAGHIQIETDVVVATWRELGGDTTVALDLMPTNMKIGLTNAVDLQLLVPALGIGWNAQGKAASSAGDIGVRLKWNLLGNDGGDVAVGVMPWVFVGGGDLRPGAGLIVPVGIALPGDFALGTMAVVNCVPVGDDAYDAEGILSATVSHAIVGDLAGYLEVFGSGRPLTREGEVLASSGLTWLVGDSIQLDAGLRLPVLTTDPRLETFVGISARH